MVRGLRSKNKVYRDAPWAQMDKKLRGITGRYQTVTGDMTPLPSWGEGGSFFGNRYWGSSLRRTPKKWKKCDFSKMNVLLPPMIICENKLLGEFVSLPKRFQRYSRDDLSKSIFRLKIDSLKYFTRKSLRGTPKKSKKCDFSQMNKLLTPMIINENKQLGEVVSLPKRF